MKRSIFLFLTTLFLLLAGLVVLTVEVRADGTETLGPASVPIPRGSGFVEGGTGLLTQPGSISVDVPADATVRQVLLYWAGQQPGPPSPTRDNTIRIEGIEVNGELIGGPTNFFADIWTSSFRADITFLNLVHPGPNDLVVDGLDFGYRDDGAGILVIFDTGTEINIEVRDGNDNAFLGFNPPLDTTVPQTFVFAPAKKDRPAQLSVFVGSVNDGRPRPNAIVQMTSTSSHSEHTKLAGKESFAPVCYEAHGGQTVLAVNELDSKDGREWDTLTLEVNIPAGASDLTVQVLSYDDGSGNLPASLTWVTTAFAIVEPDSPGAPGPVKGRMTGGGSVFTDDGQRVTHGFQLRCDASREPQSLEINWGKGNKFHLEQLTFASCTDDPTIEPQPPAADFDTYEGEGNGRYNGVAGATAHWIFTDAGQPGVRDTATIEIRDVSGNLVLEVSGNLNKGNHQAHAR